MKRLLLFLWGHTGGLPRYKFEANDAARQSWNLRLATTQQASLPLGSVVGVVFRKF